MVRINFQSSSSKVLIALLGRIVSALVGIVFVPIYVRLIGVESYGLVAFYSTLVGTLSLLDLGLSTAITRQVARLRTQQGKGKDIKDLVFSVELIYWGIGLLFGLLIIAFSHAIAVHWVNATELSTQTIERAVMLMGGVFIFLFPSSIYNGVMIGSDDQVPNSVITILFSLVKAIGVIFVLKYVNATITTYFVWQLVITLIFTFSLRFFVWKRLSVEKLKAAFSVPQLKTIWRFAIGMTGISVMSFFLMQADKVVVSKMLLLEFVGYYSIAFLVASTLNQVIAAMQPVFFPKFSALEAQNNQEELKNLYHKTCRWTAIIVFPIGFTLIFFAKEILMFWTNNPVLSEHTAPIMRVCVAGSMCNCIAWISYLYLLAKGNTRFTFYQSTIASILAIPLLILLTSNYGALGASFVWLIVNGSFVLIVLPVFHHYYMRGELFNWYKNDIAPSLIIAGILVAGAKYLQTELFPAMSIFYFGAMLMVLVIIYVLLTPELRSFLSRSKLKLKKSV